MRRISSEAVFELLCEHPSELIVSLGREGKNELGIDAKQRPRCAAMAEKFTSTATQDAYRRRKWLSEPPNGWVKNILGFRQFKHARSDQGQGRVETRLRRA
jgi:hypothetical protein